MKKNKRYLWFIIDLFNGLFRYKYPFCCVIQYSIGMFKSNQGNPKQRQAYSKNVKKEIFLKRNNRSIGYIPCNNCMEVLQ